MKQLQAWGMALALGLAGTVVAQTETQPQTTPETQPQTAPESSPQGSPAPSTSPTEGTAADRTPPGETQTRDDQQTPPEPRPSTDIGEGTAADSTPPGETATDDAARMAAAGGEKRNHRASKIIGMKVQTPAGESVGEVEDMVLDESGRISQVIVNRSSAGGGSRLAALPWMEVSSMMKADALVIERERLDTAKAYEEGSMR
jgi:sporulation protein YlmC with PRC-barrel domain